MALDGGIRLVQNRQWWLKGLVSFIGMAMVGYTLQLSYTPLMKEILSPHKWYTNPYNTIAEFMKDKPGQTVAELPFDRNGSFLTPNVAKKVPVLLKPVNPGYGLLSLMFLVRRSSWRGGCSCGRLSDWIGVGFFG